MNMRKQTLADLEGMGRFDHTAGFIPDLLRNLQLRMGAAERVTAEQWLERHADWCEPYQPRISSSACKTRRDSELSDFCKGCRGILKRGVRQKGKGE